MITSLTLEGFKSARKQTNLDLAPITVFAGPNSSGKSTVIQSLLLIAQTVQSTVLERPIVLNGHMARLGSFLDVVSDSDETKDVTIGFSVDFPPTQGPRPSSSSVRLLRYRLAYRAPDAHIKVDVRFSFSDKGPADMADILRLQPRLETSEARVTFSTQGETEVEQLRLRRSPLTTEERMQKLKLGPEIQNRPELASLEYEVDQIPSSRLARVQEGLVNAELAGIFLRHFLPDRMTVVFDEVGTEVRQVTNALLAPTYRSIRDLEAFDEEDLEIERVRPIVIQALEMVGKALEPETRPARRYSEKAEQLRLEFNPLNLRRAYESLPAHLQAEFSQILNTRRTDIAEAIRSGRQPKFEIQITRLPEILSVGISSVQRFFAEGVKYLGPLRDEPKAVYPLAGSTDPAHVGFRGEYTAAVLDLYKNKEITYVPSACFKPGEVNLTTAKAGLLSATLDWLRYLGVGTQVHTVDRGRLGHELKVAISDADALHDITQVGVGVSQVLPIVVMALLAEDRSTLILEQPELHLHPRVQSRLADFFVANSLIGKQCIVETHSDHLIHRLRHRAATSQGTTVSDAVVLYFVQKAEGQSQYEKISVNEYGVIEHWPPGFFDEAETIAAETLKAGIAKRRARPQNDHG
jgi:predicted ATPase